MLAALQWTVGIAVYLAAALALYALGEARGTALHGATLAGSVLLALPVALTAWFVRAYRRIDARATVAQNLAGIAALVAAAALVVLALFARGPLATAVERAGARHPGLSHAAGPRLGALAAWIRPAPPRPRTEPRAAIALAARDAGPHADAALATPADAGPGRAPPPPAGTDAGTVATHELLLAPCDTEGVYRVAALPPRRGLRERVFAGCLGDTGHLFEIRDDGAVAEVATLRLPAPEADQHAYIHTVAGADLDGDGASDLVACTGYLSARGGSRGGALVWARAADDGTYAPLQRLAALQCSAFALADLDGRRGVEIAAVDYGNPYDPANTNGRLLVYAGRGARWRRVFAMAIPKEPEQFALRDVNGDGALDAVVAHDLEDGRRALVYPGRGARFDAADPALTADLPERATQVAADLDGDGARDDQIAIAGRQVRITRAGPLAGSDVGATQTLEYPTPHAPRGDAGDDDRAADE